MIKFYDREGNEIVIPDSTGYYAALADCAARYWNMLNDKYAETDKVPQPEFDIWIFINELEAGIEDRAPLMKLNRWLGYIQGRLIALGYTTVEAERDWTRPLFRPLDFPND